MNILTRRLWAASLALVASFACTALANAQASAPSAAAQKLNAADTQFLKHAAEAGLAEVEAARLAMEKGVNTQVKGYAQHMIDEHTRMHAELRTLASAKLVRLPIESSIGQRTRIKLLSASDGASFDRKYADTMGVKAHQDTMKLFQKAAASASDPQVKAFAEKALPSLQQHLQTARELKGVVDKEGNAKAPGDRKQ